MPKYLNKNYFEPQIDLLLIDQVEGEVYLNSHYCLITDLANFCNKETKRNKFLCRRCFYTTDTQELLTRHIKMCIHQEPCRVNYNWRRNKNEELEKIKFKNYFMKQDIHFRIYADIECINIPISDEVLAEIYANEVNFQVPNEVPTVDEYIEARGITSIQEPIAIGYYFIDDIAKTNVYYSHFGSDCIDWFVDQMMNINYRASQLIDLPINMIEEDEIHFNETNICWLCEKETITTEAVRECNCDFCYGEYSR